MHFSKNTKVAIRHFIAANGAAISLVIAGLSQPDVRQVVLENKLLAVVAFAVFEGLAAVVLWFLHREPEDDNSFGSLPDDVEIKPAEPRFAKLEDFFASEDVYREWFSPSLSVGDAEFQKLLVRGGYERLLEASFISKGRREKRVVGYYTVWPIRRATFEDLVSGKLQEKELTADKVLRFNDEGEKLLYIPEICASKKYGLHKQFAGRLMLDLKLYIGKLLEGDPAIAGIAAWAYTEKGREIAKKSFMVRRKRCNWRYFSFWCRTNFFEVSRDIALGMERRRGAGGKFRP